MQSYQSTVEHTPANAYRGRSKNLQFAEPPLPAALAQLSELSDLTKKSASGSQVSQLQSKLTESSHKSVASPAIVVQRQPVDVIQCGGDPPGSDSTSSTSSSTPRFNYRDMFRTRFDFMPDSYDLPHPFNVGEGALTNVRNAYASGLTQWSFPKVFFNPSMLMGELPETVKPSFFMPSVSKGVVSRLPLFSSFLDMYNLADTFGNDRSGLLKFSALAGAGGSAVGIAKLWPEMAAMMPRILMRNPMVLPAVALGATLMDKVKYITEGADMSERLDDVRRDTGLGAKDLWDRSSLRLLDNNWGLSPELMMDVSNVVVDSPEYGAVFKSGSVGMGTDIDFETVPGFMGIPKSMRAKLRDRRMMAKELEMADVRFGKKGLLTDIPEQPDFSTMLPLPGYGVSRYTPESLSFSESPELSIMGGVYSNAWFTDFLLNQELKASGLSFEHPLGKLTAETLEAEEGAKYRGSGYAEIPRVVATGLGGGDSELNLSARSLMTQSIVADWDESQMMAAIERARVQMLIATHPELLAVIRLLDASGVKLGSRDMESLAFSADSLSLDGSLKYSPDDDGQHA